MAEAERIRISVVYALPDRQSVVDLTMPAGSTVAQAVASSGLLERFSQIATQPLQCAVFGHVVASSDLLADGERVEILRPLQIDPKVSRRQAAARSKRSTRRS